MIAFRGKVRANDASRSEKDYHLIFTGLTPIETSHKTKLFVIRRESKRDRAQRKLLHSSRYTDNPDLFQGVLPHAQISPKPRPSPALVEPLTAREELFSTETHEEVLTILVQRNLSSYVEDYKSYLDRRQEELEEGESPGIILQSLQSWAWFAVSYAEPKNLPCAKFRADFDGCIELIWRLYTDPISNDADNEYWGNGRGIAVLRFYPSYLNSLSILSGPYASEKLRLSLESCLSHEKTQQTIDIFSERFLNAGA